MAERIVGIRITSTPFNPPLGVGPVVPFPASEAERTYAAEQASKAALLLNKPTPGQAALFRHLAESAGSGGYVVREARWIETVLKATRSFGVDAIEKLYSFDWSERAVSAANLRKELEAFLKERTGGRSVSN